MNLSIDPNTLQSPSGSIKNAMLGLDSWWLMHVGAASIIPPTLQNDCMYSFQLLNNDGIATYTFFGRYFISINLICSTMSVAGSNYFFFKF